MTEIITKNVEYQIEFIRWSYAGKQQLQGLVRRRIAETDMCLGKTKIDKALLEEIK